MVRIHAPQPFEFMFIEKQNFLLSYENESLYRDSLENISTLRNNYMFIDKTIEQCKKDDNFTDKCVSFASQHFDLSSMVGYEFWYNFSAPSNVTNLPWHFDKDEVLFESKNEISLPLCTLVYYINIEKELGGELMFQDFEIESYQPKTNSLICFQSGIMHKTNPCNFNRVSVAICPWSYKVEKWYLGER